MRVEWQNFAFFETRIAGNEMEILKALCQGLGQADGRGQFTDRAIRTNPQLYFESMKLYRP